MKNLEAGMMLDNLELLGNIYIYNSLVNYYVFMSLSS